MHFKWCTYLVVHSLNAAKPLNSSHLGIIELSQNTTITLAVTDHESFKIICYKVREKLMKNQRLKRGTTFITTSSLREN